MIIQRFYFSFKHHGIIWARTHAAVLLNCHQGRNIFQCIGFLRLVSVQILPNCFRLRFAQIVVIILNKAFGGIHVAPLNPVDIAVFLDRLRLDHKSGFLPRLSDHCFHWVLSVFNAASWELVVIVFQAVDHGDFSIPYDDAAGGVADETVGAVFIVLLIHLK